MFDINDPKYELLHLIANEIFPEFDYDDDGNLIQFQSNASNVFLKRKDKIKFPFTYKDYIKDKDIIRTLEGYGVDIEQFWHAILFIYDITQEKCVNVLSLGETAKIQIEKLKELLSGIDSFTVTAKDKKKLVINEPRLINHLENHLETLLADNNINLDFSSVELGQPSNDLYPSSIQIWFAATRFKKLFEAINLPSKRSKEIVTRYVQIEDREIPVKVQTVYFNKMFLISQLMYLMKFTNNKTFLSCENALKGILKQYKNLKLTTFSKVYFA
jgi:hypothetical protein